MKNSRFPILLSGVLLASTLPATDVAQAQVLDGIRNSIRNLWGQKASKRESARESRAKASALNSQAEEARAHLKKAQQLMIRSNAVYQDYAFQAKQTEARIVRTRHRVQMVTAHYKEHQALFGARLASVQRNGQISYLNMLLGSRTLSDLSHRMYLYQAIAERDSDLQETIKDDKYELERAQNVLMSQWQQRNRLLQAATRERSRLILAQKAQERALKAIRTSVYTNLAQANARHYSATALDRQINELESERTRIVATARAAREQEYSSYRPRRVVHATNNSSTRSTSNIRSTSNVRNTSRNRSTSNTRYTRNTTDTARTTRPIRRRYRRTRVQYRRTRTEYVPSAGGVLKPMRVKDTVYEDVLVPEQSNGELGETFESDNSSNQVLEPWTPPASRE